MSASPAQQYCLRWNNYQNNLTNVFDQLLQNEIFVDVTLACDGNSVKAHKMVLSACSPYFQTLFFENPCKHPIVILRDVKWEELKAIVEFMYKGEINVSQEQLAPLLKVAEVLKIRGLADVNKGSATEFVPASSCISNAFPVNGNSSSKPGENSPNVNHESDRESPLLMNHHHLRHPLQYSIMGNHRNGHLLASMTRKRRKLSNDRSPSPPDTMDDHSNQLEIDSTNGDYPDNDSPIALIDPPGIGIGGSLNPSPGITLPAGMVNHGPPSANSINSISSSLLSLQNAAAAAAAVAVAGTSSSALNDLDLKPGIVEMIREEERAKMLESSQAAGWLGGGGPPTGANAAALSDSYQYQIQSLWQKCWNTNQSGLHALRFRERGPLKSWRPETMAEAIFAVLREGLSLSQAARKFDIPYPTFVLYANRVHNMLGPSSDGAGGGDLLSDMRPKGRGRPQRILLGTWPEDHIRGVIRAVVFRDGGKEDLSSFVLNRDGLCGSLPPGSLQNGLDMSLHPQFNLNAFMSLHHSSQSSNSTSPTTLASGNINESNKTLSNSPVDNDLDNSKSPKLIDKNSGTLISSLPGSASQLLLSSSRSVSVPDRETLLIMQMGKNKLDHETHKNLVHIKSEIPFDEEVDDEESDLINSEIRRRGSLQEYHSEDDENDRPNNIVRQQENRMIRKTIQISDTTNDAELNIRSASVDSILQQQSPVLEKKDGDVNTPSPSFQPTS